MQRFEYFIPLDKSGLMKTRLQNTNKTEPVQGFAEWIMSTFPPCHPCLKNGFEMRSLLVILSDDMDEIVIIDPASHTN